MSIILPQITIQHDFQSVIADVKDGTVPSEPFWISCYKKDSNSVHGRVTVERKTGGINLIPEGIEFKKDEHSVYRVACPSLDIPSTRLRIPKQVIGKESQKPFEITAFDVAPDTALYAVGDGNGNLRVSSTDGKGEIHSSKPHVSTILSVRFFPSSKVILTASNDFKLSIISAEDLTVPRILKGHSRAVTDTAIISRGRNVLSCAKDGTLRLWDVGSASQIRVFGSSNYSPIHKMTLGQRDSDMTLLPPDGETIESGPIPTDPREFETDDKVIFCALHNGTFEAFDLGTKTRFFQSELSATSRTPLESMTYSSPDHLLATGSRSGVVAVYDTRQLATPLFSFQRNTASIEDVLFIPREDGEVRLAIASADGLPYIASIRPDGPHVVEELVGYNCDSTRNVRIVGHSLWTTGGDGLIRRY